MAASGQQDPLLACATLQCKNEGDPGSRALQEAGKQALDFTIITCMPARGYASAHNGAVQGQPCQNRGASIAHKEVASLTERESGIHADTLWCAAVLCYAAVASKLAEKGRL